MAKKKDRGADGADLFASAEREGQEETATAETTATEKGTAKVTTKAAVKTAAKKATEKVTAKTATAKTATEKATAKVTKRAATTATTTATKEATSVAKKSEGDAQTWTVSRLARAIRESLESNFGRVRLQGEIASLKRAASGHVYCSLRDESASIDAVLWRGGAAKYASLMRDGAEVEILGRVTSYAPRSRYQVVIEHLSPVGAGALLARLEELRGRLEREGLFSADAKKELPEYPRVVGVVTSPTGSVIRDILHRLRARFPVHVILWPVRVQGAGSAEEIAAGISGLDRLSGEFPRPDVIIVARGGGSLEDLWSFNEEAVVRAIASCATPVISGVGHETDTTLADYAADIRAPTPTAAAEFAVPVRAERLDEVERCGGRLARGLRSCLVSRRELLAARGRWLSRPEHIFEGRRRVVDESEGRMRRALRERLARCRGEVSRLPGVQARVDGARREADVLSRRAGAALRRVYEGGRAALEARGALLESLSYRSVLARGFAVARSGGEVLRVADDFAVGEDFELLVGDESTVSARVEGVKR
ncbi:MAG: exodeoxyribonuclease VII large subunit, partial [Alphaproteobacteria bacterium]|nr:exodeoxyribonuclease VII large subunit [Alphaproteobacteria bacterium]